jgi:hypothetical protein
VNQNAPGPHVKGIRVHVGKGFKRNNKGGTKKEVKGKSREGATDHRE